MCSIRDKKKEKRRHVIETLAVRQDERFQNVEID